MAGLGFGLGLSKATLLSSAAIVVATLASIDAAGWSATWLGLPPTLDPDNNPKPTVMTYSGLDLNGAATSPQVTIVPTLRVRRAYPNHLTLSTATVALSRQVYAGGTSPGVVNNSTLLPPKVMFVWNTPDGAVVANTLAAACTALHKDGIVGVIFTITDSLGATLVVKVSTLTIRVDPLSGLGIGEYQLSADITALAPGHIRLSAKAVPRVGSAATAYDTNDYIAAHEQTPQSFLKHVAMAAAPVHAFLSNSGFDSGGSIGLASTDIAVARARPFLTTGVASTAMLAANNALYGINALDGCRLHPVAPFAFANFVSARAQFSAAFVVEQDPDVPTLLPWSISAVVLWKLTGKNASALAQQVRFNRIAFTVTAATSMVSSTAATDVWFDRCTIDCGYTGAGNLASTNVSAHMLNCVISNPSLTYLLQSVSGVVAYIGCTSPDMRGAQVYCNNMQACIFPDIAPGANIGYPAPFVMLSTIVNRSLATGPFINARPINGKGMLIANCVFEDSSSVEGAKLSIAADAFIGDTNNVNLWHNTHAGFDGNCRMNLGYNDTPASNNKTTNWSVIGVCQAGRWITKSDTVVADGADHSNNWAMVNGADCRGNVAGYSPVTNGLLDYAGLRSSYCRDRLAPIPPTFTDNRASTSESGIPTAGFGLYTLAPGSLGMGVVDNSPIGWNILGAVRPMSNANCGAY